MSGGNQRRALYCPRASIEIASNWQDRISKAGAPTKIEIDAAAEDPEGRPVCICEKCLCFSLHLLTSPRNYVVVNQRGPKPDLARVMRPP